MQYYQMPLIFCSAKVNPFSIVVAKKLGRKISALFIQLYFTDCGARSRADGS